VVPISEIKPNPYIQKRHIHLPQATVEDVVADLTRIRRELGTDVPNLTASLGTLQRLPANLSASSESVTAVLAGERLVSIEPGDTSGRSFGIAIDLGTTSVVVMLVELGTGRVLGTESLLNGQATYGSDVISRITYATTEPDGLVTLQRAVVATINSAVSALSDKVGVNPNQIYEAVIVGNSCMNHLLLGVDPRSLAQAPYQPVLSDPVSIRPVEIGIAIHPEGAVYTLPNIAGFVGSDTVAVILATRMHRSDGIRLAIDLGTNGEIVLGNRDRLLACSTAAGPAFEGARISCGMRATEGAIERVWIEGDDVKLKVIGDKPAIGLCGSGLLDAVAQMRHVGLISESGRLEALNRQDSDQHRVLSDRIVPVGDTQGFLLARNGQRQVTLTQRDVRELQLAKGAIRAGTSILLKEFGIEENDIEEILLAGAFGSFINPASARSIGLIPQIPIQKITAIGNAAAQGSLMALLSTDMRNEASDISQRVHYIELSARPDFMEQFMDDLQLAGSDR
ncbi:MAG: ASKHA domain-containing protein, partial [Chloroflexota bacterium]